MSFILAKLGKIGSMKDVDIESHPLDSSLQNPVKLGKVGSKVD